MQISYHQSQFNCKCSMPWKSNQQSQRKVTSLEAKRYFTLSHQNHHHHNKSLLLNINQNNKSKTQYTQYKSNQYIPNHHNITSITKRSLKRRKSNYSQTNQHNQNINQEKTLNNIYIQPQCQHSNHLLIQDAFSSSYNPLQQLKLQNPKILQNKEKEVKHLKYYAQFTTPNWKQTSSRYCSPQMLSLINSNRETPAAFSPKKIHFPLTSGFQYDTKSMNNKKSRSMKGFKRNQPINKCIQNQIRNHNNSYVPQQIFLFQGLMNPQESQSKDNKNNLSFQSQNQCFSNFSMSNKITPKKFVHINTTKTNNTNKQYTKNSQYQSSQMTQSQLKTNKKLERKGFNKNLFENNKPFNLNLNLNSIQFSNYSESVSRNSSNNNLIMNYTNSRKILSRDNSARPIDRMSARKVSSIFDSRQNQNDISVVIPGATLIAEMSQQHQAQSPPKAEKVRRKMSRGFDGTIILKQIQMSNY